MKFEQYYLACLSQASYLIGDESSGLAAVVDPRRDVGEYVADAESAGLRIAYVIETHFHADFLSGHLELAAATGAEIVFGAAAEPEFPARLVADGERISLGEVVLEFLATPGHTPESTSVVVWEHGDDPEPWGVLTEYRNVDRWPTRTADDVVVLRIDGPLFFANTRLLEERVGRLVAERPGVRAVVLDASATTDVDATGAHALHELATDLDAAGIALHLATVRGPIRDALARGGLWDDLAGPVHPSIGDACAAAAPGSPLCAVQGDEDGRSVHVV